MRRHLIALIAVSVLAVAGCSDGGERTDQTSTTVSTNRSGQGAGAKAVEAALVTFDDCEPLLRHIRDAAGERVGPGGFVEGWGTRGQARTMEDGDMTTAAPSTGGAMEDSARSAEPQEGTDFSGTNVQEQGVDEPDVVKTDGTTMFVVRGTELISVAVGASADGAAGVIGRVGVDVDGNGYANELLLSGDRALVLSTTWDQGFREGDAVPLPEPSTGRIAPTERDARGGPMTTLTSVDVSNPADLRVTDAVTVEGEYRTARMVDGVARVVLQSPGPNVPWAYPTSDSDGATERAIEDNQRLVEETTLDDWLPHRVDATTGERSDLVGCDDVYAPASFAGSGLVTVLTLPLAGTGPVEPKAATVLASADTVYASADSLYVAAHAWPDFRIMQEDVKAPEDQGTDLHRFDITGDVAVHTASGRVEGFVLNQFSMSEHDDRLRVATTTTPPWTGNGGDEAPVSTSSVTVFEQKDATLTAVGSVGDLGKGETIRSVRFVGDTAYVVTFRQTDPFYVVDLSDPTAPRVAGELKLPGYSGYLHPVDATHVLGVGQEGDEDGRITGVKVSLFDVSDPSAPVESANWIQENGSQQVEFDAKAFLYWPATKLAVVPVQVFDERTLSPDGSNPGGFNGAVGLTVDGASITELGRLSHVGQGVPVFESTIERSIVVGDVLWTLSPVGLLASDLQTLTPGAFVAF
jgi:hypothetical protein